MAKRKYPWSTAALVVVGPCVCDGIGENALRGVDVVGEVDAMAVAEVWDGGVGATVDMVGLAEVAGANGDNDRGGSKGIPISLHTELNAKMQGWPRKKNMNLSKSNLEESEHSPSRADCAGYDGSTAAIQSRQASSAVPAAAVHAHCPSSVGQAYQVQQ